MISYVQNRVSCIALNQETSEVNQIIASIFAIKFSSNMSEYFWTVLKLEENEAIVLFNGENFGHGSIASVDVPPANSDERDEFVKVLYTPIKKTSVVIISLEQL